MSGRKTEIAGTNAGSYNTLPGNGVSPMSELVQIIGIVTPIIGTMFAAWLAWKIAVMNATQKKMAEVGDKTHMLVNSGMTIQLNVNRVTLRRLSEVTKDTGDIEAARLAESAYWEHVNKQDKVDARVSDITAAVLPPTPPLPPAPPSPQ